MTTDEIVDAIKRMTGPQRRTVTAEDIAKYIADRTGRQVDTADVEEGLDKAVQAGGYIQQLSPGRYSI